MLASGKACSGNHVLGSDLWKDHGAVPHDLVVVGPLRDGKLSEILRSLEPATAFDPLRACRLRELTQLRGKYPRLVHVPLREDWTQTLLLVAGESLRRTEALRLARQAESKGCAQRTIRNPRPLHDGHEAQREQCAHFHDWQRGTAAVEPGQLSKQSLAQIKTIHSMALRINEIMQRFSVPGQRDEGR